MICPGCSSVIPQVDSELMAEIENQQARQYGHQCSRCRTRIIVTIMVADWGPPKLMEGWKNWVTKGINFDIEGASKS